MKQPKEGDLKVWWIPQVPMKHFDYPVDTVEQGRMLCDCLAKYDAFQFDNRIRPDCCNIGGLMVFENGEWWMTTSGLRNANNGIAG